MPALILAFFAMIIIVNLTMAVFASRNWTGFVVKNSYAASQEIQSRGGRGQGTGLGSSSHLAIANGEIGNSLRDRNGKKLRPGGVKRSMIRAWR